MLSIRARLIAPVLLAQLTLANVASAQGQSMTSEFLARPITDALAVPLGAEQRLPAAPVVPAVRRDERQDAERGLLPLFVAYGALQALDLYSTSAALSRGGRELNPIMRGPFLQSVATKAAFSTVTVLSVRAAARKNKKGAVVTMLVVNGLTAAIVTHNFRSLRRN